MFKIVSTSVFAVAVAQSPAFLQKQSDDVVVCNETRTAPNGEIPTNLIPNGYGLLMDSNPGTHSDKYHQICFGKYNASSDVKPPGYGFLSNFAVAQCNSPTGCTVYRIFDEKPKLALLGSESKGCGHYWSPPEVVENQSQAAIFKAEGVCPYPSTYAHGGVLGQKGGYLMKCTMPSGYAFTIGQTQSALCRANGSNYTMGPSDTLQLVVSGMSSWTCHYCKMREVSGTYPNVLDCDGAWNATTCD